MKLTTEQIREFYERGYVKVSGAVSKALVDATRQAFNHSIGTLGLSGEDMANHKAAGFCRGLNNSPVVTDMYNNSPVISLIESLLGEDNLKAPVKGANPALRFPTYVGEEPPEPTGHIDGMGNGKNGKPIGAYRRAFTCFAIIYLADVPEPYSGNFTVWPGSHHVYQDFFKREGIEILADGQPRIPQPEDPVMITGEAGDLIIAHHQVYHCAAPNASPNIRYATIARLHHVDFDKNGNDCYTSIWREYPCVREVMDLDEEPQAAD